ncbi:MAG: hypothetical protein V1686_01760 [Patescibacteria group bacterium]
MWNIIRYILEVALGFSAIYFYIENRRLKGFEIERDIDLKEIELDELNRQYLKETGDEINRLEKGLGGHWGISMDGAVDIGLKNKYDIKIKKVNAEKEYLYKLRDYRWIFSRPKKQQINLWKVKK